VNCVVCVNSLFLTSGRWKGCELATTNVLRTRSCSVYVEPVTSYALSGQMLLNAAGKRHGCHLERIMSYQKSYSHNGCIFSWRTILPNCIL